ncbi:MAG: preprotein translocase subunit SecA [Christensenella sp.]|nr:preprotein translocase subunit SecA [Christensenella sp.]
MGIFSNSALRPVKKLADKVEALAPIYEEMSDAELVQMTEIFKKRHQEDGESLDALLPEVFAQVREASWRVLGMKHFYAQVLGGIVLHQGNIAEMKTGEGKTLVATLPAALNAISGKGVHIVTVNEYLARRDSEWMGKVFKFLGFTVGLVTREMDKAQKQKAYACDIVYSTNNELGFDYLRDNMVIRKSDLVQRELNFAVVDEVDSILIDEARTPLIISGQGDKGTDLYQQADKFVGKLKEEADYEVDEKMKAINLTEDGVKKAEQFFHLENLTDIENTEIVHHINQALKAHRLFVRDREYVVTEDKEVVIVDEFTGRLMIGRRYSDGLHQAIEAKEGVKVERESKTLATVTFQNFFRMYHKLSGMTGTAKTEEDEFQSIYNLQVVEIPTHRPMIRKDQNDVIYNTKKGKFNAAVEEIVRLHETGRPILVGTVSVSDSEYLSSLLVRRGVKHEVLNAKNHLREAQIIAQAGKKNAVTIATNMAGRGTDILLGGNADYLARNEMRADGMDDEMIEQAVSHAATTDEEVLAARQKYVELMEKYKKITDAEHEEVVALGGLAILGTERHESRRIDNQLRGRSGRQGDPGSSKFYIALEDDLMRLFGGDRIKALMERLAGDGDDMPLEFGMLTKQIENAQKRIEGNNFNLRKNVLDYDDVMNKQREVIYGQRKQVLMGDDISGSIQGMIDSLVENAIGVYCPKGKYSEEWDWNDLYAYFERVFGLKLEQYSEEEKEAADSKKLESEIREKVREAYGVKETEMQEAGFGMRDVERMVLLRVVDSKWMDHIDAMDQFRRGIGLRALGQRDPINEYRIEGFDMFDAMVDAIREEAVYMLYHIKVQSKVEQHEAQEGKANLDADGNPTGGGAQRSNMRAGANANAGEPQTPVHVEKTVGRNAPCPCGSGKKYKNCCGKNE